MANGADNTPYEKVGNAEPLSIADEVPFEIPESWEWCRLGDIFYHNTGKALNASNQSGFNVTTGGQNSYPSESKRLNDCLTYHYMQNSGLEFLGENYTPGEEMLYSFDNVNNYTTISIIHTGFLGNDYRTISEKTNNLAKGIADGIICYVEDETIGSINQPLPINSLSSLSTSTQKVYSIPLSEAIAAEN